LPLLPARIFASDSIKSIDIPELHGLGVGLGTGFGGFFGSMASTHDRKPLFIHKSKPNGCNDAFVEDNT
jgi:hypothetical protein